MDSTGVEILNSFHTVKTLGDSNGKPLRKVKMNAEPKVVGLSGRKNHRRVSLPFIERSYARCWLAGRNVPRRYIRENRGIGWFLRDEKPGYSTDGSNSIKQKTAILTRFLPKNRAISASFGVGVIRTYQEIGNYQ